VKIGFNKLSQEQHTKLIDHRRLNGNYRDAWTGKKGSGNSQKNGISKADVVSMLKSHDEDKVKAADEKSALKNELMTMIANLTSKQIRNAQAGVSSLGTKRIKSVAFQAQAVSVEAQNANVENIARSLLEKLSKLGKDKSDSESAMAPNHICHCLVEGPGSF
jgi:hypothetical protein